MGSHGLRRVGFHRWKDLGSRRWKGLGSHCEIVIDWHGGRLRLHGERRRGGANMAEWLHGDASVGSVRDLETAAMQFGLVDGERKRVDWP